MQLALRVIAILSFVVAIIWVIVAPGFEPLLAFLAGISTLLAPFAFDKSKGTAETLDQRNRRVMLNHVENFWVKGILEKSLHGAALRQSRMGMILQSATGEELSALLPSILDKAFKGDL